MSLLNAKAFIEARQAAGFKTQAALCNAAKVSKATLCTVEQGARSSYLRVETLHRIAKATGKPMEFFLSPDVQVSEQ